MHKMNIVLRPRQGLLFLLFFFSGIISTPGSECRVKADESCESTAIMGVRFAAQKKIPFNPENYYLVETTKDTGLEGKDSVQVSGDVVSYLKEQWQYDTIDSLRKKMPESIISPESIQLRKFWYPNCDSARSNLTLPSKIISPVQKALFRKRTAKFPINARDFKITNEYEASKNSDDIGPIVFMHDPPGYRDSKSITTHEQLKKNREVDDFCIEPMCKSHYRNWSNSQTCLSYAETTKVIKNKLEKIGSSFKKEKPFQIKTKYFQYPEVKQIDFHTDLDEYLAGSALRAVQNPNLSENEKYILLISRAREIDKQFYILNYDERKLVSKLYELAARYAPSIVVKEVCLGKSRFFDKDWQNAWKHYEYIYPEVIQIERLVNEIAFDYYSAGRNVEAGIWLTRHIDSAPSELIKQQSKYLLNKMETCCKKARESRTDRMSFLWSKKSFPLKIYFPNDHVFESGVSYREEFEHAMFRWMQVSKGKLPYVYVNKKEDADITVDFIYHKKKYREIYSEDKLPELVTEPVDPFAWTLLKPAKALGYIETAKIKFYYDSKDVGKLRIRAVCMHEIGHALGLLHSKDRNSLMYGGPLRLGEPAKEITEVDENMLNKLYGNYPTRVYAYQGNKRGLKTKLAMFKLEDLKPKSQYGLLVPE